MTVNYLLLTFLLAPMYLLYVIF